MRTITNSSEKTRAKHSTENHKRIVLLVNMGAPNSRTDMKLFLKRMFRDKAILFAPTFVRTIVSAIISKFRYKSSWKKYLLIDESPLLRSMEMIADDLQEELGTDFAVSCAYSYSEPLITDKISELYEQGIRSIDIISMYPQPSFSTTGSVSSSLDILSGKHPDIHLRFVADYSENPLFVLYWSRLISQIIIQEKYRQPHLLFSAHAIPLSFVKRGDVYIQKIQNSAKFIAESLHLPYSIAYQSKIGPVAWTKPATTDMLEVLKRSGIDEIVVIPISFVNENLETAFDLDVKLIPFAKNTLKIENICRVMIPETDTSLVKMFSEFVN